ncbi:MAG: DUF302 domain-containing protein [bacterium]|nr:DUF302 domain-containing protein [bacterium]MDT8395331.1 DUF302 domain-containing protein [bacterium]
MDQERYYFKTELKLPYGKAVEAAKKALAEEGFGVLTEIDVQATLKKKLDVDFRPYVILGACNPSLAHRALQADGQIGLLLPCNVVVQETEGGCRVSAINPEVAMEPVGITKVKTTACEVAKKLKKVIMAMERH